MSKRERVKAIPWAVLFEAGVIVRGRWRSLPQRERTQLVLLARRSRGWPGNLSAGERAELRRLLVRLDMRDLAAELVALRRAATKSRKARAAEGSRMIRLSRLARPGR